MTLAKVKVLNKNHLKKSLQVSDFTCISDIKSNFQN